jgi:hypothetical protein
LISWWRSSWITAEIQQHQNFGPAQADHVADNPFVALQDRDVGLGVTAQR